MARDSERVVWHTPTEYNPYRDGPPYLPMLPFAPVKLSSEQRAEVRSLVKQASSKVAADTGSPLVSLLGMLQAVALLHQTHHWSTRGQTFYADHLLFERLYQESLEFIDQVAERAVGQGQLSISAVDQVAAMQGVISALSQGGAQSLVRLSLLAELHCLNAVTQILESLESSGDLSPGTSNLLEGIADKHETFVYLLRQRAQDEGYSYNRT